MTPDDPRPLSAVLSDIVGNVQQIVRAEIRLAAVELRDETFKIRRGAILVGAGAVVGVLGLGVLLLAAVYALSTVMSPALAALLVGAAAAATAAGLATAGTRQFTRVTLPPPKTSATVQETVQWAKTRAR
jgi:uncharacterized membrane protein YqjE